MEDHTDGGLLRRFRAGDAGAFEALLDRHQAALLRHARSVTGAAGTSEAAVQQAFLGLVQVGPRGEQPAAWLHRVTRRRCMEATNQKCQREPDSPAAHPAKGGAGSAQEAVERGLEHLPRDQREVLVLRLLTGLDTRGVAAVTGHTLGAVAALFAAGLQSLSRELAPFLRNSIPTAPGDRASGPPQAGRLQGKTS